MNRDIYMDAKIAKQKSIEYREKNREQLKLNARRYREKNKTYRLFC